MATATVAKLKIKSPDNFISFLKRFRDLDKEKGLLLELHADSLKAKAHTEDRSVVKYSKMPLVDVLEGTLPVDLIKIGIHDLKRVIDVFNNFGDSDEIHIHIKYENVSGEYIATEMVFAGPSLKIKILTADTMMYNFISGDMFKKLIDSVSSEKMIDFPFPKNAFAKVNNLCKLDQAEDFLTLKVEASNIVLTSKSFDYTIGDTTVANAEFTFYNKHFKLIDQEISTFVVGQSRMMITSQESNTIIIIGRIS